MSAPTVSVTLVAVDQSGNPVANARVTAVLDRTDIEHGFVVPEKVEAFADATGQCVLQLWPNVLGLAGSFYRVQAWNPDTGKKFLDAMALVRNEPCLLSEILVDEPPIGYDAATQILLGAQEARDESRDARDASEGFADESKRQAILATGQAEVAKDNADLAGDEAQDAADKAVLAADALTASEVARDAAQLSAGIYPDTATGLSATAVGQYFSIPSILDTEYLVLFRHDAGAVATEIKRYPSVAGLEYEVANVIHVKSNGNNLRDGLSWHTAVKTIERALEMAWANPLPTLIEWAPEAVVYTKGHLDMPDNCVIKATHRTVFLRPEDGFEPLPNGNPSTKPYKQRNVFRMGSGCFLEGVMFEGWQLDSLENPTSGFAVSFRPDAIIRRVPYAHKIAVRSIPEWGVIAPPLDYKTANPEVPVGAGVVLADGKVCSQYSIFPNIMTWGATPVTPNGIGYCAKNGGLINAVNAVSIWSHKHFMALSGGQVILSACSTQFGDYSMSAKGSRSLVVPKAVTGLTKQPEASAAILAAETAVASLSETLWGALVYGNYTFYIKDGIRVDWTDAHKKQTTRDTGTLLQCLRWTLSSGNQQPMLDFAKGLFDVLGEPVLTADKFPAFVYSFEWLRDEIAGVPGGKSPLAGVSAEAAGQVIKLINALISTLTNPSKRKEPSRITAIGHTWTAVMAGVALTKVPPARNGATIQDSILEEEDGVVIASGQDDQGNALFVGGLKIDADTGELGGPPFDQAVRRIATRISISRSF